MGLVICFCASYFSFRTLRLSSSIFSLAASVVCNTKNTKPDNETVNAINLTRQIVIVMFSVQHELSKCMIDEAKIPQTHSKKADAAKSKILSSADLSIMCNSTMIHNGRRDPIDGIQSGRNNENTPSTICIRTDLTLCVA